MTKKKLTPLFDRVLVVRDEPEGKSKGGILLPEQAKEKPRSGTVSAVGEGARSKDGRVPMDVEVGDQVWFTAYAGSEVEIGDEKFIVLNQQDILAVLR